MFSYKSASKLDCFSVLILLDFLLT